MDNMFAYQFGDLIWVFIPLFPLEKWLKELHVNKTFVLMHYIQSVNPNETNSKNVSILPNFCLLLTKYCASVVELNVRPNKRLISFSIGFYYFHHSYHEWWNRELTNKYTNSECQQWTFSRRFNHKLYAFCIRFRFALDYKLISIFHLPPNSYLRPLAFESFFIFSFFPFFSLLVLHYTIWFGSISHKVLSL